MPKRCHVLFEGPLMADIGATVSEIGWGFKTIKRDRDVSFEF